MKDHSDKCSSKTWGTGKVRISKLGFCVRDDNDDWSVISKCLEQVSWKWQYIIWNLNNQRSWWICFREAAVFPDSQSMCKNFALSETLSWGSPEFISCGVGKDVGSVTNFGYLKVLSCEPTSVKDCNIWNSISSPIGIFPELSYQLSSICATHKTWMFVPEVKPKWFTVDEGFWQGCLLGHRTCKQCTHSVCIGVPHFASFSPSSVVVFIFTTCEKVIMNYSKPVIMIKSNTGYLFLWFLVFWFLCLF